MNREDDKKFIKWAKQVKKRDEYKCQICGVKGVTLNSHHMNGWNWAIEERYDVTNGVTLCVGCHNRFHDIYEKGYNTKEQFNEYRNICNIHLNNVNTELNKKKKFERLIKFIKERENDGYG